MDILKIVGIGIISVVVIIILKQYKPEFAIYVSIISGVIIIYMLMDKLSAIIGILKKLSNFSGINSDFIKILLKITGIAILTEFAVSVCKDAGETAIANKVDFGGKIIIISVSIPIITALLELIISVQ